MRWRPARKDELANPAMNWLRVLTWVLARRRLYPVNEASFDVFRLERM